VGTFWQEIISELELAGRTGNARIHTQTLKSMKKFHKNKELKFHQITPEFLEKYEAWLRSTGGTDGGIGVRMRSIRGIFNSAINRDRIKENIYPFKIYKISKLKGKGIKKALTLEDVHKITDLGFKQLPNVN
jgi:site-specific recombinase XerD